MFPPDYGAKVESIFIPRKFFRNKILYKYYNFCNQSLFPGKPPVSTTLTLPRIRLLVQTAAEQTGFDF